MSEDILNAPIGDAVAPVEAEEPMAEGLVKADMAYFESADLVRSVVDRIRRGRGQVATGCSDTSGQNRVPVPEAELGHALNAHMAEQNEALIKAAQRDLAEDVEFAKAKIELNREYGRFGKASVGGAYGMSADEIAQIGPGQGGSMSFEGYQSFGDVCKASEPANYQDPYMDFEARKTALKMAVKVFAHQPHRIKAYAEELLSFLKR